MAYRIQKDKELFAELREQGLGATAIAKRLNVHRTTVYEIWKQIDKEKAESQAIAPKVAA